MRGVAAVGNRNVLKFRIRLDDFSRAPTKFNVLFTREEASRRSVLELAPKRGQSSRSGCAKGQNQTPDGIFATPTGNVAAQGFREFRLRTDQFLRLPCLRKGGKALLFEKMDPLLVPVAPLCPFSDFAQSRTGPY